MSRTLKDFDEIRTAANGMLAPNVYSEIYDRASKSPPGCIVEVGTAHGAATICMALASKDSGKNETVYTFDMILGGSRDAFGGLDENLKYIRDHFVRFQVDDCIELTVGKVDETFGDVEEQIRPQGIGCLMLDADGAIDRDFALTYNYVIPGAPIIIDDSDANTHLYHFDDATVMVDLKHKLTNRLIKCFVAAGLLEEEQTHDVTFFGRKPATVTSDFEFESLRDEISAIYRSVIFTHATVPKPWSRYHDLESEIKDREQDIDDYRNSMSYRIGNAIVRGMTLRWLRR